MCQVVSMELTNSASLSRPSGAVTQPRPILMFEGHSSDQNARVDGWNSADMSRDPLSGDAERPLLDEVSCPCDAIAHPRP